MKKLLVCLLVAVLLGGLGCGNDKEKGKNKDADRPKPAEKD